MNQTPKANRLHIALLGRTNAGKSSLINALTGQEVALVSEQAGTTTDPVYKAMEILPLGPVMVVDTPGLGDHTVLGDARMQRAYDVLDKADFAILVVRGIPQEEDKQLIQQLQQRKLPFLCVQNGDMVGETTMLDLPFLQLNAKTGEGLDLLKKKLMAYTRKDSGRLGILDGLVHPRDVVVLVTPIDASAPKGRMILPQQQVLRDVLDQDATAFVTQVNRLEQVLGNLRYPPQLVITDSQAFGAVSPLVPSTVPLTSFSLLFARFKGELPAMKKNVAALTELRAGDRVLICEGCTHHRQKNDIGSVQMPRILERFAGGALEITYSSGGAFPKELKDYQLAVHCGGCMLTEREMAYRGEVAREQGVPMVNYGMVLAASNGVLERALKALEDTK